MSITHIGLYGRFLREDIRDLAVQAVKLFEAYGARVYVARGEGPSIAGTTALSLEDFQKTIDLLCIVGGDGTFLRAAGLIKETGIPMIGINKGTLGFLSEIEAHEIEELIPRLVKGDFQMNSRMMICGEVWRQGECVLQVEALNDLVFSRDPMQNVAACDVFLDGQFVDSYLGDGMIFATPTGSTGYSLSAGGPIIYPGTEGIIVNAICPHQLGVTKVIVPAESQVHVDIGRTEEGVHFFADGRFVGRLYEGDRLKLTKSKLSINVIHVKIHPFFRAVHEKLLKRPHSPKKSGGEVNEKP